MKLLMSKLNVCTNEQAVERALVVIADVYDRCLTEEEKKDLNAKIQMVTIGNHFDAETARERIASMFYVDKDANAIFAPFISERETIELYNEFKEQVKGYNLYDYMVVLNDTIANFHNLLYAWWPNEDWDVMLIRFSEIAVNWLNDDDTQFPGEKAWKVLGIK